MVKRLGCGSELDVELVMKIIELKLGPRLIEKLLVELLERRSRKIKRSRFQLNGFEVRKRRLLYKPGGFLN